MVESEDKDVEVQILQDGNVIRVLDTKTKNSFNIESGDYQIKATGEGSSFEVKPDSLTMKRGQKQIVKVVRQQVDSPVAANSEVSSNSKDPKTETDVVLQNIDRAFLILSLQDSKARNLTAYIKRFGPDHPKVLAAFESFFYVRMQASLTLSEANICLLYTSPSPRDATLSRMPSSA